jgi:pimeloyl-ACP methyl ester carboxylesterase
MRLIGPPSDDVVATRDGPVRIARPPRYMLLAEMRAFAELGLLGPAMPALALAPRGDGHAVLVLPGFLADDDSTAVLRHFLDDRGYATYGWDLGRNIGPTRAALDGMARRIERLADLHGGKVSLVGWSLGGVFARELARRAADKVRMVITLAAPFRRPDASNVGAAYRMFEPLHAERLNADTLFRFRRPPPVPATAIFTRGDGIVAWASCLEDEGPERENIEVVGSHLGLPHNPAALLAIADRLALAPGTWRPYRPSGWTALFFPARSSAA